MKIGIIEIYLKRNGGVVYTKQVKETISKEFDLEQINLEAKYFEKRKYLKYIESFFYILKLRGQKNLWIRDFYSTSLMSKKRTKGKNLALIFHIDFSKFPILLRFPLFLLEKYIFYSQLKKVDHIVTISEYWKDYFLKKGYKNVHKMYCGFDLEDFNITPQEVLQFKKKYNLENKPIVYLGNCQKLKGAPDAYQALKDLDVHLVTSGRKYVDIPVLNIDADYKDYITLLKASSVVITMSQFKEGWCMTAHEAMLCQTPVIGSGLGGMRELLEGGGQIICQDFKDLKKQVETLLLNSNQRKKMGLDGYAFAKEFTKKRFQDDWSNLIKTI